MYLQNKYTKCYYNIIDRAKSRDLSKETYTEETVKKLKVPKCKYHCSHCNKTVGGKANYNRWHGDNCKSISILVSLV